MDSSIGITYTITQVCLFNDIAKIAVKLVSVDLCSQYD